MKAKIKKSFNVLILILNDLFVFFLQGFKLKDYLSSVFRKNEIKIITAADTSHFKSLDQLLNSINNNTNINNVTVYDLGLNLEEQVIILKKYSFIELKKFEFEKYPKFINLNQRDSGSYAWKPIIIYNEFSNFDKTIFWMDAGNLVTRNFNFLKYYTIINGFYSPYSSDNVEKWTHKTVLDYFSVEKRILKKRNLNAALIGFNSSFRNRNFINYWYKYALNKNIINPKGANKSNHRWDQSLLTILYYKYLNKTIKLKTHSTWGIKIHQDID